MSSDVTINYSEFRSELRTTFTEPIFENAFKAFLEQADINALTGKANGSLTPYGFNKRPVCDGARVSNHYGRGSAGRTPYMNWWVVSIYYLPENGDIILGIEGGQVSQS